MARLMEIAISQELFQQIMTDGWSTPQGQRMVCEGGLPEGAELVHSYFERGGIVVDREMEQKALPLAMEPLERFNLLSKNAADFRHFHRRGSRLLRFEGRPSILRGSAGGNNDLEMQNQRLYSRQALHSRRICFHRFVRQNHVLRECGNGCNHRSFSDLGENLFVSGRPQQTTIFR